MPPVVSKRPTSIPWCPRQLGPSSRSAAERLQALTAALSEAASEASVGDAVMQHGVTALGAYAGVLAMFTPDEEELELHNSVGYPEAACMSVGRRWPIVTNIPICEAV